MDAQPINLTEAAKNKIFNICSEKGLKGIKIVVQGGGCAGFKYDWSLIENDVDIAADDVIINIESFKLIIDGFSLMYLIGTTLDYKTEIFGSNFVFSNPNSVSTCGCGESFSV